MKNIRVRVVRQDVVDVIVTGFDTLDEAVDYVVDQSERFISFSGDSSFEPCDEGIVDTDAEWTDADEIED